MVSGHGARVFLLNDNMIICPKAPDTETEWRWLITELIGSGLLWPPPPRT
ncbi:hypothetical protein J2S43_007872 [Catenuloplanes nepalensis]|uniref:Uncharacterized protein n=1 Tax=Catenuloplanes nepalensis TaxID=587533 RepID=A0ABT9N6N1_9ACTN|nr:hypothetical protein [Catenuloplanes nepalensis]MDP9799360.1 hypothetical protein [Catenuloplanes nepalensis]